MAVSGSGVAGEALGGERHVDLEPAGEQRLHLRGRAEHDQGAGVGAQDPLQPGPQGRPRGDLSQHLQQAVVQGHGGTTPSFGGRGAPGGAVASTDRDSATEPTGSRSIPVVDLRALPERESVMRQLAAVLVCQPLDLALGPLLRVNLIRTGEDEHTLVIIMHHIISDGWTMSAT